jgi:hypothetical protein
MNYLVKTLIMFKCMNELSCNEGVTRCSGDKCLAKRNNCDMIETLSVTKLLAQILLNPGS